MKNGNGVKLKIADVKNVNGKSVLRITKKPATLKRKKCGIDWEQKYREYKARLAGIELKADVSAKLRSEKNDIIDSVNLAVKLIELCEDHLTELSENYFDKNRGNIQLHPLTVERLITTLQIGTEKIRIAIGEKN